MQGNTFFSNRVIEPWNNLNIGVVDFSCLKHFKCTLKKIDFSPYLKYSCDYFWYPPLVFIWYRVPTLYYFFMHFFVLLVLCKWRHIRPLVSMYALYCIVYSAVLLL